MQLETAVEIMRLVAVGASGFTEQQLRDGNTVGIHLTVASSYGSRPVRIDLLTWKQMDGFCVRAAKSNLRRLEDCWAIVQRAFFEGGSFSPSVEFLQKAQTIVDACQSANVIEAMFVLERNSMSDFCADLGIDPAELENADIGDLPDNPL